MNPKTQHLSVYFLNDDRVACCCIFNVLSLSLPHVACPIDATNCWRIS